MASPCAPPLDTDWMPAGGSLDAASARYHRRAGPPCRWAGLWRGRRGITRPGVLTMRTRGRWSICDHQTHDQHEQPQRTSAGDLRRRQPSLGVTNRTQRRGPLHPREHLLVQGGEEVGEGSKGPICLHLEGTPGAWVNTGTEPGRLRPTEAVAAHRRCQEVAEGPGPEFGAFGTSGHARVRTKELDHVTVGVGHHRVLEAMGVHASLLDDPTSLLDHREGAVEIDIG